MLKRGKNSSKRGIAAKIYDARGNFDDNKINGGISRHRPNSKMWHYQLIPSLIDDTCFCRSLAIAALETGDYSNPAPLHAEVGLPQAVIGEKRCRRSFHYYSAVFEDIASVG